MKVEKTRESKTVQIPLQFDSLFDFSFQGTRYFSFTDNF